MNSLDCLDKLEETVPELDDIPATIWWRLSLEVLHERALISILQKDIKIISMGIAAMKFDNIL